MEKLEDRKKYSEIKINSIKFISVQVFYLKNSIDIVDNFSGITIGSVGKNDVKNVEIVKL